jgi:hypothetical protein
MTTKFTDLKPVAKYGRNRWLLIPKDEDFSIDDDRPIYYQYIHGFRLDDPKPLQVWCKFIGFHPLNDEDTKQWNEIISKDKS